MKFNCGPTWEERLEASRAPVDWHDYFAWFPCRVGSRDCRWLELIERKKTFRTWKTSGGTTTALDDWWWEYRAKGGQG